MYYFYIIIRLLNFSNNHCLIHGGGTDFTYYDYEYMATRLFVQAWVIILLLFLFLCRYFLILHL